MRAVLVDLDAGLRIGLGVGVAPDVRAAVDHHDALAVSVRGSFGDRRAVEAGTDDQQVAAREGVRQVGLRADHGCEIVRLKAASGGRPSFPGRADADRVQIAD